jgi:DNA-directed RNA polymerase subunit L
MEVEIVENSKNLIELRIDNLTVAEILRVYLNDQGIKFVAWRKEHPTKPIFFRIESSGKTVKKSITDAIVEINKDLNFLVKELKK